MICSQSLAARPEFLDEGGKGAVKLLRHQNHKRRHSALVIKFYGKFSPGLPGAAREGGIQSKAFATHLYGFERTLFFGQG